MFSEKSMTKVDETKLEYEDDNLKIEFDKDIHGWFWDIDFKKIDVAYEALSLPLKVQAMEELCTFVNSIKRIKE